MSSKKHFSPFRVIKFISLALVIVLLGSCSGPQKRPFGYVRLGPVTDFLTGEKYLADRGFLVRRDEKGFSVMSLQCTYDLAKLYPKDTPQGRIWQSDFSGSKYNDRGEVVSGPTKWPLPYYELVLESGSVGSKRDTLFARVGYEKPPDWRLVIPTE